ncbi:hypothetical protein [Streptomyces sp. NPDC003077]|uniref:hypothetical protein n=1 Tax=Streptomyces sp. NPDC003077 TaxID=3154443 RepID=UPI0033B38A26
MMDAPRGLRISRTPNVPVLRQADGSLAIRLWLRNEGRYDADVDLRLSPAEAEVLHAQLCFALDDEPVTTAATDTPECRKPVHGPKLN